MNMEEVDVLCVGQASFDMIFTVDHHPEEDEKTVAERHRYITSWAVDGYFVCPCFFYFFVFSALFFDHAFQSAGTLEVFLDSVSLAQIAATGPESFTTRMIHITDPSLIDAAGMDLSFHFDGATGSQLLLDSIYISGVPEPSTLILLGVGAVALRSRSRRRRLGR